MRFKFTNDEVISLIMLFAELVKKYKGIITQLIATKNESQEEMLYLSIFEQVYISLQGKALVRKPKYNIKFTPTQALAFWIEFNGIVDEKTQLGNMIQQMCNKIHQQIISTWYD